MKNLLAVLLLALFGHASIAGPVGNAARSGDVGQIEQLLADGADIDEEGEMASPLHFAAMGGHVDAVRLLAKRGAALETSSDMLGTPLHAAARMGHADVIEALLDAGADPDSRDRNQFTPLMMAAMENRQAAATALLTGGSDVDAVGFAPGGAHIGKGPTIVLQLARRYENDEIAELLVAAGAGPLPPDVPSELLAGGDVDRGRELAYTVCAECHLLEKDDPPRTNNLGTGPSLIGVVGRQVANEPGFAYSTALYEHGGVWTPDRIYQFALTPALTVPGTLMNWAPDRTPEMIADITAYLVSKSD